MAGTVSALSPRGASLFMGGRFRSVCSVPVNNIAEYKNGTWSALGLGVEGGHVLAVATSPFDVYVGGTFTRAGGRRDISGVARWDGSNWHPLGRGVIKGSVQALVVYGNALFVGGDFSAVDGGRLAAPHIALFSAGQWFSLGTGTN